MKWVKAVKIECWYCGKDMGVIILEENVVSDHSKLSGTHHICQKCIDNSKEINKKVLPIIK